MITVILFIMFFGVSMNAYALSFDVVNDNLSKVVYVENERILVDLKDNSDVDYDGAFTVPYDGRYYFNLFINDYDAFGNNSIYMEYLLNGNRYTFVIFKGSYGLSVPFYNDFSKGDRFIIRLFKMGNGNQDNFTNFSFSITFDKAVPFVPYNSESNKPLFDFTDTDDMHQIGSVIFGTVPNILNNISSAIDLLDFMYKGFGKLFGGKDIIESVEGWFKKVWPAVIPKWPWLKGGI